jgi:hypothetical protein
MKHLQNSGIILLFALFSFTSFAQNIPINEPNYFKPKLFQDLPERLSIEVSSLQSLLAFPIGQTINVQLANNFPLQGRIVSSANKYNNGIQSIVIKLSNRIGASFSLSKIKDTDGSVKYTGRIISMQAGDAFELSFENGQYYLVKKTFNNMINE